MGQRGHARNNLKEQIAQAFIALALDKGPSNVSVLDIVREVGVNKNSFYYHFATKHSVAYWIFRSDIAAMLEDSFEQDCLLYPSAGTVVDKDLFASLPYYARIPVGARMLDQGAFFKQAVVVLRQRQDFYSCMFKDASLDNLPSYIGKLYYPALCEDVDFIADGRYIPAQTRDFIVKCFGKMIVGMLEELVCCQEMPAGLLDDDKNPFWNLAAESVEAAIRSHPIGSAKFSFELV